MLRLGIEIISDRYSDSTTKVIEDQDVLDVNFGKEPMMTFRPIIHDWVSRKQGFLSKLLLFRFRIKLDELSSQDNMSTSRIFWIIVVLGTIITLKSTF